MPTITSSSNVTPCNQTLCFLAEVKDRQGNLLDGLALGFSLQHNAAPGGGTFIGIFAPSTAVTGGPGSPGLARTPFTAGSDCPLECSVASGGGPCAAQVVAATAGGIRSLPLQLTINIPLAGRIARLLRSGGLPYRSARQAA